MPTTSVTDRFAEWLATPPVTGLLVETMTFAFTGGQSWLRICNRQHSPLLATDELGIPAVYEPLPFKLSKPAVRNSTELSISAQVDGVNGVLLRALLAMRAESFTRVDVAIRTFVDPIMLDRPVYLNPIRLTIEKAKLSVDVVELTLVSGRLPNKRAGLYYGLDRFPGLRAS